MVPVSLKIVSTVGAEINGTRYSQGDSVRPKDDNDCEFLLNRFPNSIVAVDDETGEDLPRDELLKYFELSREEGARLAAQAAEAALLEQPEGGEPAPISQPPQNPPEAEVTGAALPQDAVIEGGQPPTAEEVNAPAGEEEDEPSEDDEVSEEDQEDDEEEDDNEEGEGSE